MAAQAANHATVPRWQRHVRLSVSQAPTLSVLFFFFQLFCRSDARWDNQSVVCLLLTSELWVSQDWPLTQLFISMTDL